MALKTAVQKADQATHERRTLGHDISLSVDVGSVGTQTGRLSLKFIVQGRGTGHLQIFAFDPSESRKSGILLKLEQSRFRDLEAILRKIDQAFDQRRDAIAEPIPRKTNTSKKTTCVKEGEVRIEEKRRRFAEQKRLEEFDRLLNSLQCFYKNGDEVVGPVALWLVREMIESGVLPPAVPVLMTGADIWRSYPEIEARISPIEQQTDARRRAQMIEEASKLRCYYFNADKVCGPIPLTTIMQLVRAGSLRPDVQVCQDGREEWIAFNKL